MSFGKVLIFVFAAAFLIEVAGFLLIPQVTWQSMSSGQQFLTVLNLLVGFLLVVLVYWINADLKKIAHLSACREEDKRKIRRLEDYIERLEMLRIDFRSKIGESSEKDRLLEMFDQLVARFQANGFLNPRLIVDGKIAEKMALRKTIEQAIEELYAEQKETDAKSFDD